MHWGVGALLEGVGAVVTVGRRRVVGLAVAGVLLGALVVVPVVLGVAWVPELGGWCWVSGVFGENQNRSYSVFFYGVNFTFVRSTYDYGEDAADLPLTGHFRVAFGDGAAENLTLYYDGYIAIALWRVHYSWNASLHVGPRAGVLTGNSAVLCYGWQFWVAPAG